METEPTNRRVYGKSVRKASALDAPTARLLSENEARDERVAKIIAKRTQLMSIPDKLAGDKLFYKNWFFDNSRTTFPNRRELQFVDRYYPYASGGPLAMDIPQTAADLERAKAKAEAVRASGVRFYIVDLKKTLEEMLFEVENERAGVLK